MPRDSFLFEPSEIPLPSTPTGLQVIRLPGPNLQLRWIAPADASPVHGVKFYRVYHSTDNVTYSEVGSQFWPTHSFTHNRLDEATHYYKITAVTINFIESALTSAVSAIIGKLQPYTNKLTLTAGVPQVVDFITSLGRVMQEGTLIGLGPGDVLVELSADGSTYTNAFPLRPEDYVDLSDIRKNLELRKIRFDTTVTGTKVTIAAT